MRVRTESVTSLTEGTDDDQDFEPQRPAVHATQGGNLGKPDTIALVMVGLPGRGKTAVARRTARYLSFFHGLECELFNVGDRRRELKGYMASGHYSFEDPEAIAARKAYADATLNELKLFLLTPGRTAIFDASNITAQRRLEVGGNVATPRGLGGGAGLFVLFLFIDIGN